MVKLGEVCDVERGGSPRPINKYLTNDEDGVNWIKIGDAPENSMYITSTKQKITKEGMKKSRYVLPGDFLLSNSMSIGKPYILKIDGCIHDGWLVLRDKCNLFHKEYLYYALSSKSVYERFKNLAVGGVVNNLNSSVVKEVLIPLPPLTVQKQIAKTLDTVSELLSLRKQQLAELDSLTKAIFYDMFGDPVINDKGWELKKLSDCCCVNPSKKEIDYFTDDLEVSFISMASVSENGDINTNEIRKYREVKTGFTYFYENDVLFAKITPCMENGKGAIARGLKNHIGFGSTEFHVLRPKKGLSNSEWLYHLTTLPIFRTSAEKNMTGSAGQKRVPASFFDKFRVPLPPFSLQTKFADRITQIQTQKNLVKRAIEETQLLFDSLMSQYFDE